MIIFYLEYSLHRIIYYTLFSKLLYSAKFLLLYRKKMHNCLQHYLYTFH